MGLGFGGTDWISESLEGFKLSLMIEDLRGLEFGPGCDVGAGDIGRDPGIGVLVPVA